MRTHTPIAFFLPKFTFSLENNAFSYFKKYSDFSYAKQNLNIKLYFLAFFSLLLPVEPFGNINFIVQHRQRKQLCVIEWVCFAHVCIETRILSSSLHCFVKCSIFSYGTLWHKSTLKNTRSAKHCSHKVETLKHLVGMPSPSVLFYNIIYIVCAFEWGSGNASESIQLWKCDPIFRYSQQDTRINSRTMPV